ncbi:MAG: sigma 54-interacting transcriptional regulator [Spirochaetia bacterium]
MFKTSVDIAKFQTFIEINNLINSDYSDSKTVLTRILESATRLTDGEASSLLLLNPENNKLYFEIALGSKGSEVQKFSLNIGEGIAGWVVEKNRSLIVNDVQDDDRFFSQISNSVGFRTSSILAVPMRIKDQCIGVIEMINKQNAKGFSEDDLFWLELLANQAALAIQNAQSFQKVKNEVFNLQDQVLTDKGYHPFISGSQTIKEQLEILDRVAVTDSSVLILGESGAGKELFAEQVHLRSKRREHPFIRVNCAALPPDLLESELFGHVEGAFTDAVSDRRGRFELADTGTIFLDEIAELSLPLQAKMLRVLQSKSFEKVGSSVTQQVDVRIIAATNRDIEELVREGKMRQDLFYRLNVLPIHVPPLRQRKDDIPVLADHFLKVFTREMKKNISGFSSTAMEAMLSYYWPGNVRELENAVERAVVVCRGDEITPEDLSLNSGDSESHESYLDMPLKDSMNQFKKHLLKRTLERHNWNQTAAAKALGIQRTYLSRLIKELDINK